MSRRVTHDGSGSLRIQFPFDRSLVDRIKTLPSRRWNGQDRYWWVPETDVVQLVDMLRDERFTFDEMTCELYRSRGGSLPLEDSQRAEATDGQLGLFGAPGGAHSVPTAAAFDDLSISDLNERVRAAIEAAFPSQVWLVGEISGFNKSAHRRHVSFELVERTPDGRAISKVSATLFETTRREIERELERAGNPFQLEDEVTVRLQVRVELYAPWGQYRVVVEGIDTSYTLGEVARRREEIIRRLTEAGLSGRNPALGLAAFPLRIALVTSLGSDAYNDVVRTFQESGFAFELTAHGARVQGHATEPSVLNALDWIRERSKQFDAVLICRGGGSRTDLVWFDSERLGRAVAEFPIPVVVGIGHEQDRSVLDAVARGFKTPTAAASMLVETVALHYERLEESARLVLESASRLTARQGEVIREKGRRVALAARSLIRRRSESLTHQRRRILQGTRTLLGGAVERLDRWMTSIPRQALLHVEGRRSELFVRSRSILHGATRTLEEARRRIDRLADSGRGSSRRTILRELERLDSRARRLRLVDPARVVERGYAILRDGRGRVVTDPGQAPRGTGLRAQLRQGILSLRSEGAEGESGGN